MNNVERRRVLWMTLALSPVLATLACVVAAKSAHHLPMGRVVWVLPAVLSNGGLVGGVQTGRGPLRDATRPQDQRGAPGTAAMLAILFGVLVIARVAGLSRHAVEFVACSVVVGGLAFFFALAAMVLPKLLGDIDRSSA